MGDFFLVSGAIWWSCAALVLLALIAGAVHGAVLRTRARRADRRFGWDLELPHWVEFPPYAARSCHPENVDIDCDQCQRWLRARAKPAAGVDP